MQWGLGTHSSKCVPSPWAQIQPRVLEIPGCTREVTAFPATGLRVVPGVEW